MNLFKCITGIACFFAVSKNRLNDCSRYLLFSFISFIAHPVNAQIPAIPNSTIEQQLEAVTENNEDNVTEDDSFLQSLQQFLQTPLNLNTADAAAVKELVILNPIQIQNLISYRNLLGNFISIYELQAIPGWDIVTIERLRPYITVSSGVHLISSFSERLSGGSQSLLLSVAQVLEKSKGYLLNTGTANNYYRGSPQRFYIRYKYQYKNLLQFGLVADKDAGEEFFKGSQKKGFDFYSFHLFARNIGVIKLLAVGDFTVNMGQGLTQWQSLAFKKGPDVMNIKRQLSVLRPYNSAGEYNFQRGVGITLAKKNIELTGFISYKKADGNLVQDTLTDEDFISSLQTSGLHRTNSELADKGIQRQLTYGGNIAFSKRNLHIGINSIQYHFKLPIRKSTDPYNLYALSGDKAGNQSVDYSFTFKNLHFFGEAAFDNNLNKAFVNGLMLSVDAAVDMSFVYRNISEKYQSLNTNAFTESTFPNNEQGFYAGISIKPNTFWRVDAYADFYKFPWLRYQVDAPSVGVDYFSQITYRPGKQLEIYARYRTETKAKNFNPGGNILPWVLARPRQNLRTQINYKINAAITFRNRIEMSWFDKKGAAAQQGFLGYVDIVYKPMLKNYAANLRLQYFETDGYDSRLYAFESDVLYSFSIPVFYDKGYRYYINVNYDISRKLSCWFRLSQTIYTGKNTVGSGLDEIKGNKKTAVQFQVQYNF